MNIKQSLEVSVPVVESRLQRRMTGHVFCIHVRPGNQQGMHASYVSSHAGYVEWGVPLARWIVEVAFGVDKLLYHFAETFVTRFVEREILLYLVPVGFCSVIEEILTQSGVVVSYGPMKWGYYVPTPILEEI